MTETTVSRRPQLDDTLDYLCPGDQLVVTKLDRLGRSLRHLLNLLADGRRKDRSIYEAGLDLLQGQ
jgi:DNA invertase Pin-like site-specific DNA recombinase